VGAIVDERLVLEVLVGATGDRIYGDKLTGEIITAAVEITSIYKEELTGDGLVIVKKAIAVEFTMILTPAMQDLEGFPEELPALATAPGDLEKIDVMQVSLGKVRENLFLGSPLTDVRPGAFIYL